jgi:aldehyde dehydrogenase (NAD+)
MASADLSAQMRQIFEQQLAHAPVVARTTWRERREKLLRMERYLLDKVHHQELVDALKKDFHKHEVETAISESGVSIQQLRHIRRYLKQWMSPQYVPVPLQLAGCTCYVQCEPKGVCLIIAPWNYPALLTITPLAYAIAAGNTAVVKPSEFTPHTSAFLVKMVGSLFPPEEVSVCQGDAAVATALLEQPFNHIFFTGSPQVGKIVMQAASKHLASVTLELGGKSPSVIDETASIKDAVLKTAWAKCLNAGQTCIAPDYLLVHESQAQAFETAFRETIARFYQPDGQPVEASDSLAHIVSDRHHARLVDLLEDAISKGAKVAVGGQYSSDTRFIAPTLLTGVTADMKIMQEEIFGPILPMITYREESEIYTLIGSLPKPLTSYIHSRNKTFVNRFLQKTTAGGAVVNDYLLGFGNPYLPFGGVNNSGIGKSLGQRGFTEFSNEKGIIRRWLGNYYFIFPPYNSFKAKLAHFLLSRL